MLTGSDGEWTVIGHGYNRVILIKYPLGSPIDRIIRRGEFRVMKKEGRAM